MLAYHLAIQGPGNGAAILRAVRKAASAARFDHVTGLFAYVTESGAKLLLDALDEVMPRWRTAKKRWLVSLDFGRTEPEALRLLCALDNSAVFVPHAAEVLARRLKPFVCFHPKSLLLHTARGLGRGPVGLVVGSANLTFSGLSIGHEHAIALASHGKLTSDERRKLKLLLEESGHMDRLFREASRVDKALIAKYAKLRPTRIGSEDDTPHVKRLTQGRPELRISHAADLATASRLWVDIDYVVENRGRGVPGNQIDLQRGTRVFFGLPAKQVARNTPLGNVVIRYRGAKNVCHMRFGNNFMDKLNLPVPGVDGPARYDQSTLLFKRRPDGTFDLEVGSRSSINKWKKVSHEQGTLYRMRGGREFGIFS